MNYVLVFRPEVRDELDEAYSWYESQELGLGDDFLEQVDDNFSHPRSQSGSIPSARS
jgi:hypothetical protein